ncbi:Antitoxin MazE6 [Calidithermus terrae]|uniref:Antitoxin MazE6 n=1 Tax=Calidithermus terrae TaxID=1408545 RepID=A0A399E1V6_9DEIN|nr:ribbon-helix-helix protein, CopG family [Calidithermus terrae]RIH78664.1 Antitoxin MazE6 [Calidithermus terrae]
MKTAISLPDKTFEEAEKLARSLGISRSELYRRALESYLRQYGDEALTEALNEFLEKNPQKPEPFTREAARRIFEAGEW